MTRGYRYLLRLYQELQRPEVIALKQLKRAIGNLPRYQSGRVKIWGWDIAFVDPASLLSSFDYIVVRRWNDFNTSNPQPRILDCGANIGISVLHYKRLYPSAKITAFEPDHKICEVLRRNLYMNNASDVEIVEAALWDSEGETSFMPDGADGGMLVEKDGDMRTQRVKTQRLVKYLDQPIDLLKMDIEGAEDRVIVDCADHLHQVNNIVLEYHLIDGRKQKLHDVLGTLANNGFSYYINSLGNFINLLNAPLGTKELSTRQFLMISASRDWVFIGHEN